MFVLLSCVMLLGLISHMTYTCLPKQYQTHMLYETPNNKSVQFYAKIRNREHAKNQHNGYNKRNTRTGGWRSLNNTQKDEEFNVDPEISKCQLLQYICGSNNVDLVNLCMNICMNIFTTEKCDILKSNNADICYACRGLPIDNDIGKLMVSMDSVSSLVPSIGSQMRNYILENTTLSLNNKNVLEKISEIDGRVSTVVRYQRITFGLKDEALVETTVHKALKVTPFQEISSISNHSADPHGQSESYLYGVLADGTSVFMKPFDSSPKTKRMYGMYANQGLSELMAHTIDYLLGLQRTPMAVYRRILLTSKCSSTAKHNAKKLCQQPTKITIPGLALVDNYHRKQTIKHEGNNMAYADFVLIAQVKTISSFKPSLLKDKRIRKELSLFFQGNTSQNSILRYGWTKQYLRDLSDIAVFDFIIHNPDRFSSKNYKMSEGRLFPFDQGLALWPMTIEGVCPSLLHNPMSISNKANFPSGSTVNTKCEVTPETSFRFCRFQRSMVSLIQNAMKKRYSLGDRLYKAMTKYTWFKKLEKQHYLIGVNFSIALDNRMSYLTEYIETCRQRLGHKMYI